METLRSILTSRTTWTALLLTVAPSILPASIREYYRPWVAANIDWLAPAIVALFAFLPSPIQKKASQ